MFLPTDPRPTDLVCLVCGELVRRHEPKKPDSPYVCPNAHEHAKEPMTYQAWLAMVGMGMNG